MAASVAPTGDGIASLTSTPFPVQRASEESFMESYASVHRLGMTMQREYVERADADA